MSNDVFVMNSDDTYLHPMKSGARVRHMIKSGKAEVVCKKPFTIKLKKFVPNADIYLPFN